jgi:antitoxin ParD1/3/4
MTTVTLSPELERFAAEAVAQGRYRDLSDVIQAGLTLLRDAEAELSEFVRSLEEAQAEGERDGFLSAAEVERRVRAAIAEAAARRG